MTFVNVQVGNSKKTSTPCIPAIIPPRLAPRRVRDCHMAGRIQIGATTAGRFSDGFGDADGEKPLDAMEEGDVGRRCTLKLRNSQIPGKSTLDE